MHMGIPRRLSWISLAAQQGRFMRVTYQCRIIFIPNILHWYVTRLIYMRHRSCGWKYLVDWIELVLSHSKVASCTSHITVVLDACVSCCIDMWQDESTCDMTRWHWNNLQTEFNSSYRIARSFHVRHTSNARHVHHTSNARHVRHTSNARHVRHTSMSWYVVATMSMRLKRIGLFCRISSLL